MGSCSRHAAARQPGPGEPIASRLLSQLRLACSAPATAACPCPARLPPRCTKPERCATGSWLCEVPYRDGGRVGVGNRKLGRHLLGATGSRCSEYSAAMLDAAPTIDNLYRRLVLEMRSQKNARDSWRLGRATSFQRRSLQRTALTMSGFYLSFVLLAFLPIHTLVVLFASFRKWVS